MRRQSSSEWLQSTLRVRNDQRRCPQATRLQTVKQLLIGVFGFFQHGLNRQYFTMPLSVYTANDLNGHADDTASIAHFLIQRVDPEHGLGFIRQGTFPERLYLLVEPFGHLTNLTAGQVFNAQALCEFVHLAG